MTRNRMLALFASLFSLSVLFGACSSSDDEIITFAGLPDNAKQFVTGYFSAAQPYAIGQEGKGTNRTYEVILTDGTEIDFDYVGNWTEVDAPGRNAIPNTAFIIQPIVSYVEANYPDQGINSISRDRKGFEVELTLGTDLEFDTQGQFLRIDR